LEKSTTYEAPHYAVKRDNYEINKLEISRCFGSEIGQTKEHQNKLQKE
jgi:hypothetical protein